MWRTEDPGRLVCEIEVLDPEGEHPSRRAQPGFRVPHRRVMLRSNGRGTRVRTRTDLARIS